MTYAHGTFRVKILLQRYNLDITLFLRYAQRVKAQVIKKHQEDIVSEEVPKQIYNNNKVT